MQGLGMLTLRKMFNAGSAFRANSQKLFQMSMTSSAFTSAMVTVDAAAAAAADGTEDDEAPSLPFFPFPLLPSPSFPLEPLSPWPSWDFMHAFLAASLPASPTCSFLQCEPKRHSPAACMAHGVLFPLPLPPFASAGSAGASDSFEVLGALGGLGAFSTLVT